ncbi:hypothetical protein JS44_14710 [Anoxybacillus flavithermus]|uniref:Uncharacterized protein n=1 Tax=Anoxybacillus flavithermus TaxID=33934 RepID=A0A094LBE9_9BACL|nr:hypothetical protein JS44_14710 [Anoxybacillus flavithermus]
MEFLNKNTKNQKSILKKTIWIIIISRSMIWRDDDACCFVKQYFQQKPNSYVPTIVTTKPSSSVTASVSYTPAKAMISEDVVTISDAAKRTYEQ